MRGGAGGALAAPEFVLSEKRAEREIGIKSVENIVLGKYSH